MKIESSSIQLASQHTAIEKDTLSGSLKIWVGNRRPDFEKSESRAQRSGAMADTVTISRQAQALATTLANQTQQTEALDPEQALENDPRYQLIKLMVEELTGKKINLVKIKPVKTSSQPVPSAGDTAAAAKQAKPAGFGVEYDRLQTHYESEQTSFAAKGLIKTSDGKSISFNLSIMMNREYTEQSSTRIRLGDAKTTDPLTLNFNGTATQLTNSKFSFDLDADGQLDQISFVGSGSGFLALDKNRDGVVNNGSELFGPATGNGFAELADYDQDHNHWIDENDAIYQNLSIWTKDATGKDNLSSLKQSGVGAIYLGNVSTPFELKNEKNQLEGQIKSSGIYLNENGSVGSVQQIDLAV